MKSYQPETLTMPLILQTMLNLLRIASIFSFFLIISHSWQETVNGDQDTVAILASLLPPSYELGEDWKTSG